MRRKTPDNNNAWQNHLNDYIWLALVVPLSDKCPKGSKAINSVPK